MSVVEPHTPEPGWLWRWTKQSIALLPRMGLPALVHTLGFFVIGAILLSLRPVLDGLFGRLYVTDGLLSFVEIGLGIPVLLWTVALIVQADQGTDVDHGHLQDLARRAVPGVLAAGAFICVLNLLFSFSDKTRSEDTLLGFLSYGHVVLLEGLETSNFVVLMQAGWCVLAVPFVVGLRTSWTAAKAFDAQMDRKIPTLTWRIAGVALAWGFVANVLGALVVGLPLSFLLVVWITVAAREIAGGIRSNGKGVVHAPKLATAPSA